MSLWLSGSKAKAPFTVAEFLPFLKENDHPDKFAICRGDDWISDAFPDDNFDIISIAAFYLLRSKSDTENLASSD